MAFDGCALGLDGEVSVGDSWKGEEVLQHAGDVLHGGGRDLIQDSYNIS